MYRYDRLRPEIVIRRLVGRPTAHHLSIFHFQDSRCNVGANSLSLRILILLQSVNRGEIVANPLIILREKLRLAEKLNAQLLIEIAPKRYEEALDGITLCRFNIIVGAGFAGGRET